MRDAFAKALHRAPMALVLILSLVLPAESRVWSQNPINLATDYLIINDNRGGGEIVLVFWLAPPMLPSTAQNKATIDLLEKYVVIGVAHGHFTKEGIASFDAIPTPDVRDQGGQPLSALSEVTMSPAMVGALAILQSVYSRSLGALGQGVHWFAYDGGALRACAKGGLSVEVANEKYTYDTPVPGCPTN